ncbi:VOC family protein [Reinekea blandensis]|uniref:Putative lactoylglutathione lyase n=1 Tax=Reinekea blandensis MED297 TaxID=314283 RepID=A4B8Z5_9GAMM|nr:VOC family protein [Reinekea blandensis]EAR11096.1 putative lactoylglutathione lyase [Reinekea sp. MED297] [Reinekea blandensis MED297]
MLQLEHINLVIRDLKRSLHFYRAAFPHWHIRSKGDGEWYGKPRTWVHFGDDHQYIALNEFGEGNNRDLTGHQVGLAHFAFVTVNLDALIERLESAGFAIANPGATEPHRRNVYFIDPDGFEIEFVQYLSDSPAERNAQPDNVTEAGQQYQAELDEVGV